MNFVWTGHEHGIRVERIAFALQFELKIATQAKRNLETFGMYMERRYIDRLFKVVKAQYRQAKNAIRLK